MFLNLTVILTLPISRYLSLFLMVSFSIVTFLVVLTVAFICLIRGVREARFYILGWLIFLTGVSITILERAVILPYTTFTEYAGQIGRASCRERVKMSVGAGALEEKERE